MNGAQRKYAQSLTSLNRRVPSWLTAVLDRTLGILAANDYDM
jgi:hypothetical protein